MSYSADDYHKSETETDNDSDVDDNISPLGRAQISTLSTSSTNNELINKSINAASTKPKNHQTQQDKQLKNKLKPAANGLQTRYNSNYDSTEIYSPSSSTNSCKNTYIDVDDYHPALNMHHDDMDDFPVFTTRSEKYDNVLSSGISINNSDILKKTISKLPIVRAATSSQYVGSGTQVKYFRYQNLCVYSPGGGGGWAR